MQTLVDDDMRGRVMSFFAMAVFGVAPFGSLLAGTLAERFGAPTTLLLGGAVTLLAALAFSRMLPGIRVLVRPIHERLGGLPELATGVNEAARLSQSPPA